MKKNILLCFIDKIEDEKKFNEFISKFDNKNFEVHAFNNILENNFRPDGLINLIEDIWKDKVEENNYYFLSNIKDFFTLTYRLYHQIFNQFIYYHDNQVDYSVELDEIYTTLLKSEVHEEEKLFKNIFTNIQINNIFDNSFYNSKLTYIKDIESIYVDDTFEVINKYYYLNNKYYLFEPMNGEDKIINISNEENLQELNYFNTIIFSYNLCLDETIDILKELNLTPETYVANFDAINKFFNNLKETIISSNYFTKEFYIKAVELIRCSFNNYTKIFILTFLMYTMPRPKHRNETLTLAIECKELDKNNKFFVLYQCIRVGFVSIGLGDEKTGRLTRTLYRKIYNEFKNEISDKCKFIPKKKRDKDLVIVMIAQFLNLTHGPTKTALDRCYSLMKKLGKKVVLINTKEMMTTRGLVPVYNISSGSIMEELESVDKITYKDIDVPFYQTGFSMPDLDEIFNMMNFITKHKPYSIIAIGGMNLTADLCSNLVPLITISTPYFSLPLTEGQFHVIGRNVTDEEIEFLSEFGFNKENVIESIFTFDFKPQENTFSREDLNLPKDKFLMAVVGGRLDHEVTDEFIETLLHTAKLGTHIVFIGCFEKYKDIVDKNKKFAENSTYLGFQNDILAVLENCDLYVNPLRGGGGTSVVEAMYKGVPAVTINSGDVSVAAGEDFCVKSYDEMIVNIEKYVMDKKFYNLMSEKAKKRAEVLMNTHKELQRILYKAEKSKLFK